MASLPIRKASVLSAGLLVGSLAAMLPAGPLQSQAIAAESWPAKVDAVYRIEFSGFDIGSFTFNSSVHGKTYVLQGNARVSALLGIVKWQGLTRAAGTVRGANPKPAAYTFDYRSGDKGGSIKMGFSANKVSNVSAVPPSPATGTIPLKPEHLIGVLDPLSALMAMTKAKGGDPCAHRLPVFDGKQRFDLLMSYEGKKRLAGRGPASVGYVCQIRYVPVAGYEPNAQTQAMADSRGIKIILRPVPGARLLIPYQIIIPTIAGTATLTARRVLVTTSTAERIALAH